MSIITVIVPCYNGYKYMNNCLNSLEKQTFKDFDVLIVDDCSTDDSLDRIKEYINKSKLNIRVIHNETNQKLAYTRQIGIKNSNTDWVCFCDCDDWYDITFLEKMIGMAKNENSDVVLCQCTYAYSNGKKRLLNSMHSLNNNSSKNEFLAFAFMSMCTCIFKKTLFENISVPQINTAEDGAVTPQIFSKANKISIIHDGLYYYFMRIDSLSSKPSKDAYKGMLIAQNVLENTISNEFIDELEFIGIKNVCYSAILVALKSKIKKSIIKEFYREFLNKHPNWYNNKYKRTLSFRKRVFLMFVKNKWYFLAKMFTVMHSILSHH